MFDLFRSREKSVRYLLGALLTLVAASMVITLVPGYGGGWGRGGADPQVLAEIGDEKVTAQDVRQFLAREGRSLPRGTESMYVPMIVEQLTAQKAVVYQAERMGLKVSDEELARIVQSLIPQLFEGGKFAGKEVYAQMLAQQNMTIPQFEETVRAQALQSKLAILAVEGMIVTPAEVEKEFKLRNEKIKVAYFGLTRELLKNKVSVTPEEVQSYFEKNKASYQVPEKRSYMIYPIDEAKVAESVKVPDSELQRAYAAQQERFRTPERVHARHILLKTMDKQPAEVAAIQKKMEDLLQKAKSGADFADLARKNSEDTGSAVKGGDLDWIVRGQTVPEFEKAAFELKPGEISGLVKTQYGFHVIKVEAHEQARLRPFEEVKAELAGEVAKAQVFDKMQKLADQLRSLLVKSPAEAEKFARENGITPVRADNVAPGAPVQEVGVNADFNDAVKSLPKNGVTPSIPVGQTKLVIAQVLDITPAHQAQLADVEKQVRDALLVQKLDQLLQEKINEANQKFKTINGDLTALAKQYGADVKTSELVTREGAITGLGAASSIDTAFSKNVGDVVGPLTTGEGTFYVKVLEKQPADLTQLASQREQMQMMLKQRKARERETLFQEGIVQELIKQKKVKIFDDNVKKLVAAYVR